MAKQSKAKKPVNFGKGKVTPVQIAFIVDRFLADNNFSKTHSAFRSEASDLFSRTKGKEVPKGLLGLGDILDEYISLKEQRIMVDQEKRRVEMAFQGLQDVMRAFHSAGNANLPPPPLLAPHGAMTPNAPFPSTSNPNNGSPPGHSIHMPTIMNHARTPILPTKAVEQNNFSTPMPNLSSSDKRKVSKSAPKILPSAKRSRTQPPADPCVMEGTALSSRVPSMKSAEDCLMSLSAAQSTFTKPMVPSVEGSCVAKSLFKHPPDSQAHSSSPKTPPQDLLSQCDKDVSPVENSSFDVMGASTSQRVPSSSCSIISSERIIISPLKRKGFYSVERSFHVKSSPLKVNSNIVDKREHVKGRLDFDDSDVSMGCKELVASDSSPSSNDEEIPGSFDFDLTDFDIIDVESLSKFLVEMDVELDGISSGQQSSDLADFVPMSEHNSGSEYWETNQTFSNSSLPTVTETISEKDMGIQGPDTLTTMRSMTKRVKIISPTKSPIKTSGNCSSEQTVHLQNHTFS